MLIQNSPQLRYWFTCFKYLYYLWSRFTFPILWQEQLASERRKINFHLTWPKYSGARAEKLNSQIFPVISIRESLHRVWLWVFILTILVSKNHRSKPLLSLIHIIKDRNPPIFHLKFLFAKVALLLSLLFPSGTCQTSQLDITKTLYSHQCVL